MTSIPPILPKRSVSLALQGGGAHGAFTWGVLDRLLEDGRLEFDGISGTSAGAMNATVLAHGLLTDGRDGARAALRAFWEAVAKASPFDLSGGKNLIAGGEAPAIRAMLSLMRQFGPQQINPFNINPLATILAEQIDFEALRVHAPVRLFVAATHANTGRLRLFRAAEISLDALLASACLPFIHRTVEIDGEPYWDGAYSANPAVSPLIHECDTDDVLLVMLSPMLHGDTPASADAIGRRATELAFNSTFLREMRGIAELKEAIRNTGALPGVVESRLLKARFHLIEADTLMSSLSGETRLATHLPFLEDLMERGRQHATEWLENHFKALGHTASIDLHETFC